MLMKFNKKEICSLLGTEVVSLKEFRGIEWAQDGMVLRTSRNVFLNRLIVKITWPCESAKHATNRERLMMAVTYLFAQCDERYVKAVMAKKAKTSASAAAPTPEPANA
jgi:hypothetical protein